METILLTDDELKRLETRFGSVVRKMGPWNSDGVFGYESVPIAAVERAADALENPNLVVALSRLRTTEQSEIFVELLENVGPVLIETIVAAYHEIAYN